MMDTDLSNLTDRQKSEKDFHNQWAMSVEVMNIDVEVGFTSPTAAENTAILKWFGAIREARLLDLGCGMGDAAVYFAKHGAYVEGVDVSDGMIKVAQQLAESEQVGDHFSGTQMPAEKLVFEDNQFDLVYGNGVLHHVHIDQAIREVYRVLKPGGRAAFIEPLSYNPVIWVYRLLASAVRSEDERPLSRGDIEGIIRKAVDHSGLNHWQEAFHKEYHLATLLLMVWFFIGERLSPSKERYWKLFLENGPKYQRAYARLDAVDRFLFRAFPMVRWFAWNTVIYLRK